MPRVARAKSRTCPVVHSGSSASIVARSYARTANSSHNRSEAAHRSASEPFDSEVVAVKRRRVISQSGKRRILRDYDGSKKPGERGALLRKERVYSSTLTGWRKQLDRTDQTALGVVRRGPKVNAATAQKHRDERLPAHPRLRRSASAWGNDLFLNRGVDGEPSDQPPFREATVVVSHMKSECWPSDQRGSHRLPCRLASSPPWALGQCQPPRSGELLSGVPGTLSAFRKPRIRHRRGLQRRW